MDLFYNNLSTKAQLSKLKKEIGNRIYGNNIPNNFKIIDGNIEHINNNVLILMEYVSLKGFMKAPWESYLTKLCNHYKINNKFISYSYLIPTKVANRNDIINGRSYIELIISIIRPNLIVCIGENTVLSFLNRKKLLHNFHGQVVEKYENIPIIITYPMGYYLQYGRPDEKYYRQSILKNDWDIINSYYKNLIKE